jgi:hypothetical protein
VNHVTRARVLLIGVALFAAPHAAYAEFFFAPFMGMKFGGETSIVDLELAAGEKKLALGVAGRFVDDGILGYEVEFGNVAGYFENEDIRPEIGGPLVKNGSYVNDLTGSVLLSLPPGITGGGWRPYAVIGGGIIHAQSKDYLNLFQVRRTVAAINFGVGATGMFTNNVGVRLDVRHLRSITSDPPSGGVGHSISYSRFTIGLLLRP